MFVLVVYVRCALLHDSGCGDGICKVCGVETGLREDRSHDDVTW